MKKKVKPFADFSDAMNHFILSNCATAIVGMEEQPGFSECDVKIHIYRNGSGYIHLLGQDSDTIDFVTMDHYKLTNTPKPKHLR